jgi:hypothetical protein
MTENNKPLDTDSEVEELFADEDSLAEEGAQDVDSVETLDSLTLSELNVRAGREGANAFKSKEDFFKHYDNLKSFVGRKEPKEVNQAGEVSDQLDIKSEIFSIKSQLAERDFISEAPEAKDYLDIIRAVAKDKKITLKEAWNDSLKEIAEGANAKKKELEIGVKSKNRLNPMQSQKAQQLAELAKTGNTAAQEALLKEMLGK